MLGDISGIIGAALLGERLANVYIDKNVQHSKGILLSENVYAKRKRRTAIAKKSRRINRKK